MLRKFRININGKEYMVEMEEIGGQPQTTAAPAPIAAPAPAAQVISSAPVAAAPAPVAAAEGQTVDAPMPGTILRVDVKVGDRVAEDQVLVVLEAMKMENEIVAPKAGIITAVYVQNGTSIDVGKPIVSIA